MDKKEYDRLRYIANRDKKLLQVKNYYQEHKQKVQDYQKEYNIINKDKLNERQKEYYKKYPEKFNIKNKKWRDNNPKKVKEYEESDKYKKQSKIARWKHQGIITEDWDNIHNIYMDTTNCDYCKKKFKNSLDRQLDHDHSLEDNNNIRGILCRVCNTTDVLKNCPPIF